MRHIFIYILLFFLILSAPCQTIRNDSLNSDYLAIRTIDKVGSIMYLHVDYFQNDFNDFMDLLDTANIDLLNSSIGIFGMEMSGLYKNYYAGLSLGYSFNNDDTGDSLEIEFNTTQYGLHFGYILINNNRFLVTPKVALKWNRFRLLNSDNKRQIPLEQYFSERDLDLRFNQVTVTLGLNISVYKQSYVIRLLDYWPILRL